MITNVVICDFCGEMIEDEIVEENGVRYRTPKFGKTNNIDVNKMFPHLCERCAANLDNVLDYIKEKERERASILKMNNALNEARRIKLKSKG